MFNTIPAGMEGNAITVSIIKKTTNNNRPEQYAHHNIYLKYLSYR